MIRIGREIQCLPYEGFFVFPHLWFLYIVLSQLWALRHKSPKTQVFLEHKKAMTIFGQMFSVKTCTCCDK